MKTTRKIALGIAGLALLSGGAVWVFRSHDDVFSEEGLLEADAADLQQTVVSPHLETPLAEGKNVLWCGTFQLAWNETCKLTGEDLHFVDEPPMVAVLNQKSFTTADLDAGSYVALAGFVRDDIHGQIRRQLDKTFQGQARPRHLPPPELTPRPQDIVAYAYLFKNLEFPVPFERIEEPLRFGTTEVPCFGIGHEYKPGQEEMFAQISILDYQDQNDFVIELKTKSEGDRLILAKVPPQPTLEGTLRAVERRAANPNPVRAEIGDVLKVPKFNFDLTRRYKELIGKRLLVANPQVAPDLWILDALQAVRFQLDEKGVRLRSESHLDFGCAAGPRPLPPAHKMLFDRPFLLMLQRRDAEVPYFTLWVANAELLVKAAE